MRFFWRDHNWWTQRALIQYAYEHVAIFLEFAAARSQGEALTILALCGAYLAILGWALTSTMASVLVAAHDVGTTQRLGFILLLSIVAGMLQARARLPGDVALVAAVAAIDPKQLAIARQIAERDGS